MRNARQCLEEAERSLDRGDVSTGIAWVELAREVRLSSRPLDLSDEQPARSGSKGSKPPSGSDPSKGLA